MRRACLAWLVVAGCAARSPLPPVHAPGHVPQSDRAAVETPSGHRAAAVTEDRDLEPDETIDDGLESSPPTEGEIRAHPLDGWSQSRLEEALLHAPQALGSISWGEPGAGALVNGVRVPASLHYRLMDPAHAWGTQETVDNLVHCLELVAGRLPGGSLPYIGHLSAEHGGPLNPHVSHQSGRDADVGYYLKVPDRAFLRATADNLDRERSWALVRALITDTDVELILIDRSIQRLLREYARSQGEDEAWLGEVFDGVPGRLRPLVLHAHGHATHLHVRFASPLARETARRLGPLLARHRLVEPPRRILTHRAKSGDTLATLAHRYRATVKSIMQANGLASTRIRAGKLYRIPVSASSARPARSPPGRLPIPSSSHPVLVEKRRLPPRG